jgi:hypothetical protein
MRGHIATIAEVWDGDHPHFPKGAPAKAISVAALYNIESYIATLKGIITPLQKKPVTRKKTLQRKRK